MEELSWFQRYLGVEAPALFEGNDKGEINFHNFATDESENLYYPGFFVGFVVVPFLFERGGVPGWLLGLEAFVPSRPVVLASALPVAYNYDMWNVVTTQTAFFVTVLILSVYAWQAWRGGGRRALVLAVLGTVVVTQGVFLALGDRFVRLHDVTEYKELLIPVAILLYALEVGRQVAYRRSGPARVESE